MAQLLDVFGFLSVVLRGLSLALQSLVVGGLSFSLLAGRAASGAEVGRRCRSLIGLSALGLALTSAAYVAADAAILMGTTGLDLVDVIGAGFFLAGSATVAISLVVALLSRSGSSVAARTALVLSAGLVAASVMTSHAAARLENRGFLALLTGLHHASTAVWVGGLPYLLIGLSRASDPAATRVLAARFSRLAQAAVSLLLATGAGLAWVYVDAPAALLGTAYGAMVSTKIVLFAQLLLLGCFNFLIVRRARAGDTRLMGRLRRLTEAEVGIGFTVILAAGSLTSQPPAADLAANRVPLTQIAARFSPAWPRFTAPAPGEVYRDAGPARAASAAEQLESFVPGQLSSPITPEEIAFSEFNHHWAGVFVLAAGMLAIAARAGVGFARHWPWTFLGLGVFIFFMADADYWPLGRIPFWSGFAVSEVLQHRLILPLVFGFAWFEWRVQTGRARSPRAALVFPLACGLGGAILLTHTHSLNNLGEELFAELSHIPIALLGVAAGWSRWLELRLPDRSGRPLAWVWPICFALVGVWLIQYRES